jgi:hypothetical protein
MAEGFHRNSPIESRAIATSAPGRGPRGPGFAPRSFAGGPTTGARPEGRHDPGAGDEATQARASHSRRVFKPGEPWSFVTLRIRAATKRSEVNATPVQPRNRAENELRRIEIRRKVNHAR